jgi:hypothetical protein
MKSLVLVVSALAFSGCGIKNPYAAQEKKCKFNCSSSNKDVDSPRNHPRNTTQPSGNVSFWLDTFNSTNAVPLINGNEGSDAAFVSLIKTNPLVASKSLVSVGAILSHFRSDLEYAKTIENGSSSQSDDVKTCLKNAFGTPWTQGSGTVVNFGKCIPLNHSMFTANNKTEDGGIIAYTEYEKAITVQSHSTLPTVATAFDLRNTPPFFLPGSTSLTDDVSLSFHMSSIILQTAKEFQQKKLAGALREWSFAALGESAEQPFRIDYSASQSQLTLNGDAIFIQQTTLNPASDDSFQGQRSEGNFIQVSFEDFRLTGPQVLPDTNLGFSNSAILTGSYLVAVNYSKSKPGFRNHFVQVTGKGVACQADGFIIMTDEKGNPSKSDPFPIDLCATPR